MHEAALSLLARREQSRRELGRKLRGSGYARQEVEATLDRLEAVGLVSDARYARLFVSDRLSVNPQGKRRMVRALRQKGIAGEIAAGAVDHVFLERGLTERELAEALGRKRLRGMVELDGDTSRRRLFGYLARRGFDPATVAEVLNVLAGSHSALPKRDADARREACEPADLHPP